MGDPNLEYEFVANCGYRISTLYSASMVRVVCIKHHRVDNLFLMRGAFLTAAIDPWRSFSILPFVEPNRPE